MVSGVKASEQTNQTTLFQHSTVPSRPVSVLIHHPSARQQSPGTWLFFFNFKRITLSGNGEKRVEFRLNCQECIKTNTTNFPIGNISYRKFCSNFWWFLFIQSTLNASSHHRIGWVMRMGWPSMHGRACRRRSQLGNFSLCLFISWTKGKYYINFAVLIGLLLLPSSSASIHHRSY